MVSELNISTLMSLVVELLTGKLIIQMPFIFYSSQFFSLCSFNYDFQNALREGLNCEAWPVEADRVEIETPTEVSSTTKPNDYTQSQKVVETSDKNKPPLADNNFIVSSASSIVTSLYLLLTSISIYHNFT